MPKEKDQLFADFVHFTAAQGYDEAYKRDPRQSVPSDCVFIRFRYPGGGIFTSAGIVQFRQRADGVTACKAFVEGHDEPIELQMNFPSESSQTFASPTFAADHVVAQSRWLRWKRAVGAWWH